MGKNERIAEALPSLLRSLRRRGAVLVLFLAASCTKPEAYYEVFREQRETYREVTKILTEIEDEKSMAAATAKLQEQFEKFAATARKGEALPKPPPPEVTERLRDDSPSMQRAIADLQFQVGRVQKLAGGKAFFKQFESKHSGLLSAVQP